MKVQRNQCARRVAAVDAPNRACEVAVPRRHDGHTVIVDEAERNVGARERETDHVVADLSRLGRVRLEKFLARGRVKEKILDAHTRPDLTARVLDHGRTAAADVNARAEIIRRLPRQEGKM